MTIDVNAVNYLETMKQAVIDAIEDIKGFDITPMDVRKLTSMTSYMIVASAHQAAKRKPLPITYVKN